MGQTPALLVLILIATTGHASQDKPAAVELVGLTEQQQQAYISSVIDGNTVVLGFLSDGSAIFNPDGSVEILVPRRAKLLAIRAPKHNECYAQQSKAALEKMVLKRMVIVTWDKGDKYTAHGGDFLVYLSTEIDINADMISYGNALVAKRWPADRKEAYLVLQEIAQSAPSGTWRKVADGGCIP